MDLVKLLIDAGRVSEANDLKRRIIESSSDAGWLNGQAWALATDPEEKYRDPALALAMAREAVDLAPRSPATLNTLGVARYRTGDWKGAIAALDPESEELARRTSTSVSTRSSSRWPTGSLATRMRPVRGTTGPLPGQTNTRPRYEDLVRFRAEAEELMKEDPGKKPDRP